MIERIIVVHGVRRQIEQAEQLRVGIGDGPVGMRHANALAGVFYQAFEYLESLAVVALLPFAVDQVGDDLCLACFAPPQTQQQCGE